MTVNLELGQMMFGQPTQEHELPYDWSYCLAALGALIERAHDENPSQNTGARFNSDVFQMHTYSWSDDDQPFNFAWRDVRVSWYKYLGRGETCNDAALNADLTQMMLECIPAIAGGVLE